MGALSAEVLPILWALEHARATDRHTVTGRLGDLHVGVVRCGVGPSAAARRTRAALGRHEARRVVSLGTCGGLVAGLAIGHVVTADAVLRDVEPVGTALPMGDWPRVGCSTVSVPVADPAARDRLAHAGAGVCEMEAAAVQEAAGERAFSVIKVVSDLAGGGEDSVFTGPRPLAIARFNLRALRLSRDVLTPAVLGCLRA